VTYEPSEGLPDELAGPGLPNRVYLDTVAIVTWIRLHVAREILKRLRDSDKTVLIEQAVLDETRTFFEDHLAQAWLNTVLDEGSIQQCSLDDLSHSDWELAAKLARQMQDGSAVPGSGVRRKRGANIGEAATIVYIQTYDNTAVFVTRDTVAQRIAMQLGITVIGLLAFIVIEVAFGDVTISDIWSRICDSRECQEDVSACTSRGMCPDLTEEANSRGEMPGADSQAQLEHWMRQDVAVLVTLVRSD